MSGSYRVQVRLAKYAPRDGLNLGIGGSAQNRIALLGCLLRMSNSQFVQRKFQHLGGWIFMQRVGRPEFNHRLVRSSLLGKSQSEIVVRHVIAIGYA